MFLRAGFSVDHSEAATKHYLQAANTLPDGYWDEVFKEKSYYENTVNPAGETLSPKGNEVGEFDVLYVNYDDKLALYKEIKTSHADMLYAREQLERAEEHFEDTDWEVIGRRVLED